jgi:hypothetical protein
MAIWALSERSRAEDLSENLAATATELEASAATVAELETELAAEPTLVVVGSYALTERQQDMVDIVTGPWIEAWKSADGDAVAGFYTSDAVLYDMEGDVVLSPTDGTLQNFASGWPRLDLLPGILAHDDRMSVVVRAAGLDVGAVLDFTTEGELLIESTAMYNSYLGPHR